MSYGKQVKQIERFKQIDRDPECDRDKLGRMQVTLSGGRERKLATAVWLG